MNYDEAIKYIHSVNWVFCKPGLERIQKLCEMLGNPQDKLNFIHVAGTNGKGSFCAMLDSVLTAAGYKVGLYTSPYVRKFNERMAVDGMMIEDSKLAEITEYVKRFGDLMEDKPTEFELITAIAFEYFVREGCDYVVLECGLGGRLDATNIIRTPVLSVITGIALDHTAILGDTIPKIAGEKAGIIKKCAPVLWCGEDDSAREVIENKAKEVGTEYFRVDHMLTKVKSATLDGTEFDFGEHKNVKIKLLGSYQPFNASNVLCAVDILRVRGLEIPESAVLSGLESTVWHARFEILSKSPLIISDGGHNPEGVDSAVKSAVTYFGGKKMYIVTGVMKDKDYNYIAGRIGSIAEEVFCLTPDNPRALTAGEYAGVYRSMGIYAQGYGSVAQAVTAAYKKSLATGIPVLCTGSLYMYGQVCDALEEILTEEK